VEKLLSRKTYAYTALRNIAAIQLPLVESRPSYWTIDGNVEKQTPFIKLMTIKDGEEHNGIYCFVKELLLFARSINSKMSTVDNSLFEISSIKANIIDSEIMKFTTHCN
jgi:hypothetical protein